MYLHVHACIHMCVHACMHAWEYEHLGACMYIDMCAHACVYVHFCNIPPQVLKLASLAPPNI